MLRIRGKHKYKKNKKKFFFVNERIRVPQVIVIDENNQPLGNMATEKALILAQEKGLDLVEVNPKADPPVCKILDYGQFQYQQSRKAQQQKAHTKKIEIKCLRLSYKIDKHDLEFRKNQALKFLAKGDKVKIETILRGRERQYLRLAMEKMDDFVKSLGEDITIEQPIKKQGNQISTLFAPTKN
ncbi:translation initiation factor IF-3 [Patescibacteria group bacterium]|nr:translation initiation factor IF-3 [Patescibacteria group bacterium]